MLGDHDLKGGHRNLGILSAHSAIHCKLCQFINIFIRFMYISMHMLWSTIKDLIFKWPNIYEKLMWKAIYLSM